MNSLTVKRTELGIETIESARRVIVYHGSGTRPNMIKTIEIEYGDDNGSRLVENGDMQVLNESGVLIAEYHLG